MDRGILRDERNLVVAVILLVKNPKCRCVLFWNLRVFPPMPRPPKKEGDCYVLTTMIPLVRPYFVGGGGIGGFDIRFPSDVSPGSSLGKDEFPPGSF